MLVWWNELLLLAWSLNVNYKENHGLESSPTMTIWNFIDDDELGMLMRVFGSVSFFEEASFEEANEVITKLKDVIDQYVL